MISRLFRVAASEIVEHPTDLMDVPLGPIEGWECYAISLTKANEIIGPFTVIVTTHYFEGTRGIKAPGEDYMYFWSKDLEIDCNRDCWYQSGVTLRFIKCKE